MDVFPKGSVPNITISQSLPSHPNMVTHLDCCLSGLHLSMKTKMSQPNVLKGTSDSECFIFLSTLNYWSLQPTHTSFCVHLSYIVTPLNSQKQKYANLFKKININILLLINQALCHLYKNTECICFSVF